MDKDVAERIRVSKLMSYILRHGAEKYNLVLRSDGYADLTSLLDLNEFKRRQITERQVLDAVEKCDKNRFEITECSGVKMIRAVQGHSIRSVQNEGLLTKITKDALENFKTIVHGTYFRTWALIKENGLSRMSRNHIHFATGYSKNECTSGMRGNCNVFIELDADKALEDGMELFVSKNGVILTEGFDGTIPVKYFKGVYDLRKNKLFP